MLQERITKRLSNERRRCVPLEVSSGKFPELIDIDVLIAAGHSTNTRQDTRFDLACIIGVAERLLARRFEVLSIKISVEKIDKSIKLPYICYSTVVYSRHFRCSEEESQTFARPSKKAGYGI